VHKYNKNSKFRLNLHPKPLVRVINRMGGLSDVELHVFLMYPNLSLINFLSQKHHIVHTCDLLFSKVWDIL